MCVDFHFVKYGMCADSPDQQWDQVEGRVLSLYEFVSTECVLVLTFVGKQDGSKIESGCSEGGERKGEGTLARFGKLYDWTTPSLWIVKFNESCQCGSRDAISLVNSVRQVRIIPNYYWAAEMLP